MNPSILSAVQLQITTTHIHPLLVPAITPQDSLNEIPLALRPETNRKGPMHVYLHRQIYSDRRLCYVLYLRIPVGSEFAECWIASY